MICVYSYEIELKDEISTLAREENRSIASKNVAGKQGTASKYRNRVEFRVPKDELWIHDSLARFLFEEGYIHKPTVGEAAKFSLNLYAQDYTDQGRILAKRLSGLIPITHYDKIVKELEHEKHWKLLYKKANETFYAASKRSLGE
jgi:hypothetical protein